MQDRKFIIGAIVGLVAILVLLTITLLWNSPPAEQEKPQNPFAETTIVNDASMVGVVPKDMSGNSFVPAQEQTTEAPRLRAVAKVPVIGATVYDQDGLQMIRYTERGTGNVLDTALATVEPATTVSSNSITRIGESLWSPDGTVTLVRRYTSDAAGLTNYLGRIVSNGTTTDGQRTPTKLDGRALPENIVDAALSPDGEYVFFLERTDAGVTGYLESTSLGVRRSVWSSPLTNLSIAWDAPETIVVYTNPASIGEGMVWLLNPAYGTSNLVLAKQYGLAARTDPTGERILYSMLETKEGVPSLRLLDTDMGKVVFLPQTTIVEKCAWGTVQTDRLYCAIAANITASGYLEQWYMGRMESQDTIWQIDLADGTAQQVLNPVELTKDTFDIVDLVVSPNEDFLIFRTRQNSILWATRIPEGLQPNSS